MKKIFLIIGFFGLLILWLANITTVEKVYKTPYGFYIKTINSVNDKYGYFILSDQKDCYLSSEVDYIKCVKHDRRMSIFLLDNNELFIHNDNLTQFHLVNYKLNKDHKIIDYDKSKPWYYVLNIPYKGELYLLKNTGYVGFVEVGDSIVKRLKPIKTRYCINSKSYQYHMRNMDE